MTPFEQQEKYLTLFREGAGYICFKPRGGEFTQVRFVDAEEALEIIDQQYSTSDIWVSMAKFPDRRLGRSAAGATTLCSLWIDVDVHDNSRYQSREDAREAALRFVETIGLPKPNATHMTGYGYHLLWSLKIEMPVDAWQRLASKMQSLFKPLALYADPITSDAARILRVAGTMNFRDEQSPVDTEFHLVSESLVDPDEIEAALDQALAAHPTIVPSQTVKTHKTAFNAEPTVDNIDRVRAMLACIDPDPAGAGGGNRANWMRIIWSIASTGWGIVAYDLAREWSEQGDLFDEKDFHGVWDSYDPDWSAGKSKSGVGFGTLVHFAKQGGYIGLLPDQKNIKSADHAAPDSSSYLITTLASDIKPEPVQWLVEGSIPLGAMAVIGGQPGLGKSQIAIRLGAAVTTGQGLPNGETYLETGSVVILANEDDAARTIRPRLDAAGADVRKVHIVQGVSREGQADPDFFQLDTDIRELRIKAHQIGDVRLIIIDPPSSYLGPKVDAYKESDVRRVLSPLATLAQETGALVLLVVHLNKRTDGGAQQRIGGSTAWVAAPRVAFLALEDQKTKDRFLLPVKNNLGDDRTGFQYQIREQLIDYGDQTIKAPHVEWLAATQRSAHELLEPPKRDRTTAVDDAKAFLEDELATGVKTVTDLKESAKSAGISWASIQRAKKELVISSAKVADHWEWQLLSGGSHV